MLAEKLSFPLPDDLFMMVKAGTQSVSLKLEGLNPAGSIKIKTAFALLDDLEKRGLLGPGVTVVESSSGNLGIALSMLCSALEVRFVCVCDPNAPAATVALMTHYGANVEIVEERDNNGGFLGTRLARVRELVDSNPSYVWTDQYSNPAAKLAHHRWTGPAILRNVPNINYLFVGVGTSATAMGCAEYLCLHAPHVQVIAVDSVGSVSFGAPAGRRHLPGLGMSQPPPFLDMGLLHDCVLIEETDTVRACWEFWRRYGFSIGPSTGTVLAAIASYAQANSITGPVVAISPDLGERYQSTLYDEGWVAKRFPDAFGALLPE